MSHAKECIIFIIQRIQYVLGENMRIMKQIR